MTGGNESQATPTQNPVPSEEPANEPPNVSEQRPADGHLAEQLDIVTGLYANRTINLVEACHHLNDIL